MLVQGNLTSNAEISEIAVIFMTLVQMKVMEDLFTTN